MEHKVCIENETKEAIFIAGKMLLPGDSREFFKRDVPASFLKDEPKPEAKGELTLTETLLAILEGNVASVLATLPTMDTEQLTQLGILEGERERRVTIGRAIEAEIIGRASKKLDAEKSQKHAQELATAQAALATAKQALDAEGDTDKHPGLEAAVKAAQATVDALTADQA